MATAAAALFAAVAAVSSALAHPDSATTTKARIETLVGPVGVDFDGMGVPTVDARLTGFGVLLPSLRHSIWRWSC